MTLILDVEDEKVYYNEEDNTIETNICLSKKCQTVK